jgi:hypothetical protein
LVSNVLVKGGLCIGGKPREPDNLASTRIVSPIPATTFLGDGPRYFSNLRFNGVRNLDLSLSKEFTIREGRLLRVCDEAFNALNHQRFAYPDLASGDGSFGIVDSTTTYRRMQFGACFRFQLGTGPGAFPNHAPATQRIF